MLEFDVGVTFERGKFRGLRAGVQGRGELGSSGVRRPRPCSGECRVRPGDSPAGPKGADLNEKDQVELRCSPFLSEEKLFDVAFDARRSFLRPACTSF